MRDYGSIIENIVEIINNLVALGAALALFYFLWGIVQYLTHGDDSKKRADSVKTITYGLIALFVLVAMWALVYLIQVSILPDGGAGLIIPQF